MKECVFCRKDAILRMVGNHAEVSIPLCEFHFNHLYSLEHEDDKEFILAALNVDGRRVLAEHAE